ncbi:uncharacterized protein LOC121543089 isoform X2 [Coregonus clupeaformis]|uniref:uncharacterized protein LOC121543089 isoform X2 n=1 Tax=Coregonus clupeaformis TaxID=59861 RepID=UPI001E1C5571|nr:uncharacterized protein LOC121543089 isoform X2 [Coregonus clupeaformis]
MNSCLQNEENARAVENAIRTAVNTVMDVIYNMNCTKILEYERKVAERDKENETLKCKLKKAEDELTAFRVGLSFEFPALSPERDFGKPMCNENEVASETDWRMDFPSLDAGTPGLSAERTRGQSPSPSPVIKEEPADTGSFYIKWEMSEESIAEQQEGLGPMHVLGKESDGTSSVAGSQSPGDRRSEQSEETSTERVKRRLSSAETQRQYRERIRADPEKLRAYKERAKCRTHGSTKKVCDNCKKLLNCASKICESCKAVQPFKKYHKLRNKAMDKRLMEWSRNTILHNNVARFLDSLFIMLRKVHALGFRPVLLIGKQSRGGCWGVEIMTPTNPQPGLEEVYLQELLKYYESLLKHIPDNQPPTNSTEATSGSMLEEQEGEEGDVSTGEGVDERAADVGEDDGDRTEGDEEDMEPDYQPPAKNTK